MDLTDERKAYIDGLSAEALLRRWRFSAPGDSWFQGETGIYWKRRIAAAPHKERVAASKKIGW